MDNKLMDCLKADLMNERIKMIKAMEFIARHVNDEEVFEEWLVYGVADEDIQFGDLDVKKEDVDELEYYVDDNNFAEIMGTFLDLMSGARKSGGLYCGKTVSKGVK